MELTDYIIKWYDGLPKDLQEWMSRSLMFYMPDDLKEHRNDDKPIELFRSFINRKNLHLFAYIGHVIYIKSLIDFFFDYKKTGEDWEKYGNELLDELDKLKSEEYRKYMKNRIPAKLYEDFEFHNSKRIEGIMRYLKNYDKDSTTYILSYEEWQKICKNELSSKSIKKWEQDAFDSSLIQKYIK